MTHLALISLILAISSSLISRSSSYELDVVNICAYSTDPSEYTPNCYNCMKVIYTNALLACLNATDMPKNITFKGANCMEQNCKIEYPTPAPETEQQLPPIFDFFGKLLFPNFPNLSSSPLFRFSRSVKDNSIDSTNSDEMKPKFNVVQNVHTFVAGMELGEPEYTG